MRLYKFRIEYTTGAGVAKTTEAEVYANNQTGAKNKVRTAFNADYRRIASKITNIVPVSTSAEVTPVQNEIKVTVVDTKTPCLTREQVETVMAGNIHRANAPYPVGSVVHIKRGPAENQGVYKVRSAFVDYRGKDVRTLEREGLRRPDSVRFATITVGQLNEAIKPREVIEYKVLYPDDRVFTQSQPNTYSSYGLDQLVQIKITKVDGKIVRKEIV